MSGRGPGVQAFSYTRDLALIIAAFIFVSAVELPVVHLLLPWDMVRIIALVMSVWGLMWMVGLLASVKVFPHLLDADGLRIRCGATADLRVPWDAVASVASRRASVPKRRHVHVDGTVLSVPVLKQTRVDVVLERPTAVGGEEITEVRLFVDDPRAFVARVRERLAV